MYGKFVYYLFIVGCDQPTNDKEQETTLKDFEKIIARRYYNKN